MENLHPEAYSAVLKLATIARYGLCQRSQLPEAVFEEVLDTCLDMVIIDRKLAQAKILSFMDASQENLLARASSFMQQNPDTVLLGFSEAVKSIFRSRNELAPQLVRLMLTFSKVTAFIFNKSVPEVQIDIMAYGEAFEELQAREDEECAPTFVAPSTDTRH